MLQTLSSRKRTARDTIFVSPTMSIANSLLGNLSFIRFAQGASLNMALSFILRGAKQKMLTSAGLNHATYLGILLWTTMGFGGYVLGVSFLVLGSALTRVGRAKKEALGIAEKRGGARGPENLWGAAGVAALCAISTALIRATSNQYMLLGTTSNFSQLLQRVLTVAYCSAIASKCADTSSSEIGKAFGTKTFLITSFKQVPRGTEGGVSIEGTFAGFLAAVFTGILALCVGVISNTSDVFIVAIAGNCANLCESIIGASLQSQAHLTNEQVNFINTLIGACCGALLCSLSLRLP